MQVTHIKRLISIAIIFIISLSINTNLFTDSDHNRIIAFSETEVLSPVIMVDKSSIRSAFTFSVNQMKLKTLFSPINESKPKPSLTEIFGNAKIGNILDVATGNGSWMRDVRKQPWVAANASIVGIELKTPVSYPAFKSSLVDKEKDWDGLNVVNSEYDPAFPENGSLDLVHEAFLEVSHIVSHSKRLERYDQLIKNGGWFVFAHISHEKYLKHETLIEWFKVKKYSYDLFMPIFNNVPEDYPKTFWWLSFMDRFHGYRYLAPNYLIVAQKMAKPNMPQQFSESVLFEQSI